MVRGGWLVFDFIVIFLFVSFEFCFVYELFFFYIFVYGFECMVSLVRVCFGLVYS